MSNDALPPWDQHSVVLGHALAIYHRQQQQHQQNQQLKDPSALSVHKLVRAKRYMSDAQVASDRPYLSLLQSYSVLERQIPSLSPPEQLLMKKQHKTALPLLLKQLHDSVSTQVEYSDKDSWLHTKPKGAFGVPKPAAFFMEGLGMPTVEVMAGVKPVRYGTYHFKEHRVNKDNVVVLPSKFCEDTGQRMLARTSSSTGVPFSQLEPALEVVMHVVHTLLERGERATDGGSSSSTSSSSVLSGFPGVDEPFRYLLLLGGLPKVEVKWTDASGVDTTAQVDVCTYTLTTGQGVPELDTPLSIVQVPGARGLWCETQLAKATMQAAAALLVLQLCCQTTQLTPIAAVLRGLDQQVQSIQGLAPHRLQHIVIADKPFMTATLDRIAYEQQTEAALQAVQAELEQQLAVRQQLEGHEERCLAAMRQLQQQHLASLKAVEGRQQQIMQQVYSAHFEQYTLARQQQLQGQVGQLDKVVQTLKAQQDDLECQHAVQLQQLKEQHQMQLQMQEQQHVAQLESLQQQEQKLLQQLHLAGDGGSSGGAGDGEEE